MRDSHRVGDITSHVGYWLRFVSNHVSHQFKLKLDALGVTVAEWVVLRELFGRGEPVNPSQVAAILGLSRGAVSKLVDRLVLKKLVHRTEAGTDRRFQLIRLTPAGSRAVPVLARLADQNDVECFGFLAAKQRADLVATLRKVAEHLELKAVPVD